MKVPAKARWSLYAIAAVLTVAAMWLVNPRQDDDIIMPASAPSPSGPSAQSAADAPDHPGPAANDAITRLKRQIEAALGHDGIDPFRDGPTAEELEAAAAAQAAAVAAHAVAAAQQQPPAAPAAPPPPPPPPPFRYLGHWKEQGRALAFLQSGDRVVEVDGPGPLDGSPWTVVTFSDDLITLKLPKGPTHTLSFEAPGNDAPAPAPAAPAAAATPTSVATPSAPARGAPPAKSAQEAPSRSAGIEHAPGWEEN